MEAKLKDQIKKFVSENINEIPLKPKAEPFWHNLRKTGTEIWLDTGDMEEAEKIWSAEMTALTTNNTLLNNEIQKGIYDSFISEARKIVKDLPLQEQIIEIAFILNARHGLRLAKRFGGFVSVELHTDTAHDYDAIVDYGLRYFDICPGQFIVKVPYTPTGLLGARKLIELGVRINFTLEFSARQNVMVAAITKPNYLNVFLGRLGAYIKDNGLGDGSGVGEKAVLETQKWVNKLTSGNKIPTKLIGASLRNAGQLELLAGIDVFTIPTKVAANAPKELSGKFVSNTDQIYLAGINDSAKSYFVEKLWEVSENEVLLAKDLDKNLPKDGDELVKRCHEAGCGDLFPYLSETDLETISADGKIPVHAHWDKRIVAGEIAIDTLLNLAGLASFTADQTMLDERIKNIIGA